MVLATSAWRAERNAKARARLMRRLPDVFPPVVLAHALAKPFVPPTPRRAIESYWRHHPVRADKLARPPPPRNGPAPGRARGDGLLLAPPPGARRKARPRARRQRRRARGLDLASDKPRQGGPSG